MDGRIGPLVPIAMMGWLPVTLVLFALLTPRRAVILSFLAGWMFLPVISYKFPMVPDLDKTAVISLSALVGTLFFDPKRMFRFRFRWIDVPMLMLCWGPLASSLTNGLGLKDGISESVHQTLLWGLPWLIGRLYLTDLEALREFAIALFFAGLVYAPFCLLEIRISPQLHYLVYGFHQHSVFQQIRYGGWRPMLFMQHGLMVGLFMASATLCGAWLRRSGSLRRLFGLPLALYVIPLFGTTLLIKSVGAFVLLLVGTASLYAVQFLRSRLPFFALAAIVIVYVLVRMTGVIPSSSMVAFANSTLGGERAQSLESRLVNEDMLTGRAFERALFGWGGWGRARIYNESGEDVTITDSLWIITLGNQGLFGLAGLLLSLLIPPLIFARRLPVRFWYHPDGGACAALAVVVLLWAIDNVLNAMINPVYLLIAGGLAAFEEVEVVSEDMEDESDEEDVPPLNSESTRDGAAYLSS